MNVLRIGLLISNAALAASLVLLLAAQHSGWAAVPEGTTTGVMFMILGIWLFSDLVTRRAGWVAEVTKAAGRIGAALLVVSGVGLTAAGSLMIFIH